MTTREHLRATLADLAAKAKATLPECAGRVDSAVKMVLAGDVELLPTGEARVASRSNPERIYTTNGTCDCQDFDRAPSGWCAHRIARGLALRVERAMHQQEDTGLPESSQGQDATSTILEASTGIPAEPTEDLHALSESLRRGLVYIKDKPFIRFSA